MTEIQKIHAGHINLRGDAQDRTFAEAVAGVIGQDLPVQANTVGPSTHRAYWLGPDEWQIVSDPDRTAGLVQRLEEALAGLHVAVNDISGGQVVFQLTGAEVPSLLARGCPLDLNPAVFGVGRCAQSGLAKANVLLGCIDAAPVYEIIVRRSFSEYLERWLRQNIHSPVGSASY